MEPLRMPGTIHTVLHSIQDPIKAPKGVRSAKPPKGLSISEEGAWLHVRYMTYKGERITFSPKESEAQLKASSAAWEELRRQGQAADIDATTAHLCANSGIKHRAYYARLQQHLIDRHPTAPPRSLQNFQHLWPES